MSDKIKVGVTYDYTIKLSESNEEKQIRSINHNNKSPSHNKYVKTYNGELEHNLVNDCVLFLN